VKETQGHKTGAELSGPVSVLLQVDEICWVCLFVAQEGYTYRMNARADILNSVGLILLPQKVHSVLPENKLNKIR